MKNILLLLFFCTFFALNIYPQDNSEITEENYLKLDKEIWDEYELEANNFIKFRELYPDKRDSLYSVYKKADEIASKRNIDAAIKFASVPSGLRRLFMVRLDVPKDTIRKVLNSLPASMQDSSYGRSLQKHLETKQIAVGDDYYDFVVFNPDSSEFRLSSLEGKNILLLYGGLDCMGDSGRKYLENLYESTDRESFEIVVYWPVPSLKDLIRVNEVFHNKYIQVSDFKMDENLVKIVYGAQSTPTCFLIDKQGKVVLRSVGLNEKRLNKLKDENKL